MINQQQPRLYLYKFQRGRETKVSDDIICNIAIYVDDTTLYSKCDQASDLWQWPELDYELESDLWDAVD